MSVSIHPPLRPNDLIVTAAFLNSTFVPTVCFYSGATADVCLEPILLVREQPLLHFIANRMRGIPRQRKQSIVYLPAAPRALRLNRWINLFYHLSFVLLVFGFFGLLMLGALTWIKPVPQVSPWLFWVLLGIYIGTIFGYRRLDCMHKRNSQVFPVPDQDAVRLRFSPGLPDVQALYTAAWQSFQLDGARVAAPEAKDEGWEDTAVPGWDEVGNRT